MLGSEGGGPGALTRKLCDAAVTLEMAPGQATGVDSYNVSVAAGILCYEVMLSLIHILPASLSALLQKEQGFFVL